MLVCRWIEWKIFQGFFKNKKEKHMKGLSFITQFKIEILLPSTNFRKVLWKMLDSVWFLSTRGLLQDPLITEGSDEFRIAIFCGGPCMFLNIQMISWINVSLSVKAKNYVSGFAYAISKNNIEC